MTIFEKNLECLRNMKSFHMINVETIIWDGNKAVIEMAKNGDKILGYKKTDRIWYMNSRYNPVREAEKFIEDVVDLPEQAIMTMYGFSNGEYIRTFLKKNKANNHVFVYEPSKDLFLCVMNNIDITDILSDERVSISVSGINEDYFAIDLVDNIDSKNIRTSKYVELPNYIELFEDEYEKYRSVIKDKYLNYQIAVNTMHVLGKRIVETGLKNMKYLPNCRSVVDYIDKFPKDMLAIVVAAGPSLVKNVELLKEAKGKALIVVVDSAIRTVMSRGIKPDFVITVDNSKLLHNFEADGLDEVFFLADMSANTQALELVKPRNLVFYSTDSGVWSELFREQGTTIGSVYSGGSVALDAFTLMIALGFKRIVLIGQDLAMTGNKQYADGEELKLGDKLPDNMLFVKDIYGNDILTKTDYFSFIRNFEDVIYANPDVDVIDATEGGALIRNTEIMTLRDVIDQYCTKEYDVDNIIESNPRRFTEDGVGIVKRSYASMKNNIYNIGKRMSDAAADCNRAASMLRHKDFDKKTLKKINDSIGKLDEKFLNMGEYSMFKKFDAKADFMFSSEVHIREENDIEDSIALYKKCESFYRSMANAAKDIVKLIRECEELLEK